MSDGQYQLQVKLKNSKRIFIKKSIGKYSKITNKSMNHIIFSSSPTK